MRDIIFSYLVYRGLKKKIKQLSIKNQPKRSSFSMAGSIVSYPTWILLFSDYFFFWLLNFNVFGNDLLLRNPLQIWKLFVFYYFFVKKCRHSDNKRRRLKRFPT